MKLVHALIEDPLQADLSHSPPQVEWQRWTLAVIRRSTVPTAASTRRPGTRW